MEQQPLVLERVLNAPVARVWSAISDRDEMKQWYFQLAEFKPTVGFEFRFTGGSSPEKQYEHICEVTEAIPQKKLTYSWRYAGYEGISYVTFELFPEGEKTKLVLTHRGLDSFPTTNDDFATRNFTEGWNGLINKSLVKYLEA